MKAAHDRQKSYANKRRRPIEFNVGDSVMLNLVVKGNYSFQEKMKLSPSSDLPAEVDEQLNYVEQPIEIVDRKKKKLCRKVISLVKVIWKHHKGSYANWEAEIEMMKFYP
ncbi:uncharacterized protein LOC143590944 [Bidens hawaiensis]|uniref:uncharacterized protein LOC143590944 n=1 Tax=Bidens hawaiensis TaxID=980011 RepID=UPI00404AB501